MNFQAGETLIGTTCMINSTVGDRSFRGVCWRSQKSEERGPHHDNLRPLQRPHERRHNRLQRPGVMKAAVQVLPRNGSDQQAHGAARSGCGARSSMSSASAIRPFMTQPSGQHGTFVCLHSSKHENAI